MAVADAPSLAAACRDAEPDVIVAHWWLGGADGPAAAGASRERRVPVVLVTGGDLSKPIRGADLKDAVERAASAGAMPA